MIPKKVLIVFIDTLSLICAYSLGLILRFDFVYSNIPLEYLIGHVKIMPALVASTIGVYWLFKMYHSVWSLVGMSEMRRICGAFLTLIPVYAVLGWALQMRMPIAYWAIGYI